MRELVSLRKLIEEEGFAPENAYIDRDDICFVDEDDVDEDAIEEG